ncbi:MAG TPA: SusC/RagA family TonB-linked outer membrane protein, partial [Niabella sp.]|nr:SusC/RagA family TonB-linked outer membrane protein [Niabella sp.]
SKRSFAGSVSTIDSEVLERTPAATLDLKLQGQAAGVMVTNTSAEPGGNVSIRIRGSNSISGNNEPLYVVDGYPLPPGGEASGTDRTQNSNFLSGINPDDIINIQILKDASATAIYGSRGANGVVIITTRQGKEGTGKVDVSYRASLSSIFNVPRMLNLADYALLQNQFAASQGNTNLPFNGESEYRPKPEDAGPLHVNWVDVITRNAINHNAQVNFSGGRAGTTYMLSANYISEDGVVKYTGFKRGSVRLNLQTRILPGLNAQTNISITRSDNNRRSTGSGNINAADGMFQALRAAPIMRAAEFEDFMDDVERIQFNNPLIELADRKDLTTNTDVLVNTLLKANIVKSLTFFTRVGVTMRNSDKEQYSKKTTWRGYLSNGLASVTAFNNINFLLEPYLQYNNGLGNAGRINVTLGGTFQRDISKRRGAVVNDFPFDDFTTDNLGLGLNRSATTSSKSTRQLISAYTRIHYDLRNKYILTLTARQDGSSVFATSKKWAMFPSAAVAWNVKREGFMQQAGFLNELKLRASYGLTGNQSIPELGSITRLGSANYNFGTTEYAGFAPAAQFGNPDLRWETTRQMNVGADVEIIKSKIAFTIEYFNKK